MTFPIRMPEKALRRLLAAAALLPAILAADAATVRVGDFSANGLDGWSDKVFTGHTRYTLVSDGARRVLKAESAGTASGLYKKVRVDLLATPYLHWSWKTEHTLGNLYEHTKRGDDYPARVYVVFSGGLLFWRTRAINYVWSNDQPPGSTWTNAFTGNARMVAVRSGNSDNGRWMSETRNVREDFRRLFGEDARYADAVAIMTDTDNSGTAATSYYGDIYFSSR
jgi:Protein of unknown function (DUF3047)